MLGQMIIALHRAHTLLLVQHPLALLVCSWMGAFGATDSASWTPEAESALGMTFHELFTRARVTGALAGAASEEVIPQLQSGKRVKGTGMGRGGQARVDSTCSRLDRTSIRSV